MSTTFSTITCQQLHQICDGSADVDVIDVRTPSEFREVHCTSARNIPLDKLDPQAVMAERNGSLRFIQKVVL